MFVRPRVQAHGLATATTNPFGPEILAQLDVDPAGPAKGRHYTRAT
jgi:hypothetical protein